MNKNEIWNRIQSIENGIGNITYDIRNCCDLEIVGEMQDARDILLKELFELIDKFERFN